MEERDGDSSAKRRRHFEGEKLLLVCFSLASSLGLILIRDRFHCFI